VVAYALVEGGVADENDVSAEKKAEKKGTWFQKKDENPFWEENIEE